LDLCTEGTGRTAYQAPLSYTSPPVPIPASEITGLEVDAIDFTTSELDIHSNSSASLVRSPI
jgi:hypothetical protein